MAADSRPSVDSSASSTTNLTAKELYTHLYPRLRGLARAMMAGQTAGHTLQPTALVNEFFLKLQGRQTFRDPQEFFRLAVLAMRQVLIDHALRKRRRQRMAVIVPLDSADLPAADGASEQAELDDLVEQVLMALDELGRAAPRDARVVTMYYLDGKSTDEIAREVGRTPRHVRHVRKAAVLWLLGKLEPSP